MSGRLSVRRLAFGASGMVFLALSACGSPGRESQPTDTQDATAVFAKFAEMEEPERTEALIEAAQAEGVLALYGSPSVGEIGEAFSEKYDIELQFFEANVENAAARITEESKAGRNTADALEGSVPPLLELGENGLLGRYESPLRHSLPAEAKGEFWTAHRRQPLVVGYNTDLVSPAEIPDDYLGFADPKWQGKISMDIGDYDWYMSLVRYYLGQGMSRDEVDEAFQGMASNARLADGHSDQVQLLAAGQFGATMSSTIHHIEQAKADGAPVTWGGSGSGEPTVEPIFMVYNAFALTRNAPHPATATLFLDFVTGPEGAELAREEQQLPVLPGEDDPLEGLELVTLDRDEYIENGAKWAKEYDELLRTAPR